MQVDVTLVVTVISGILGVGLAIYTGLLKYTVTQKENELNRRIEEGKTALALHVEKTMTEQRLISDRLHVEEKATIAQNGEIKLVQSNHAQLDNDLEEIKRNMSLLITKAEFEPRISNVERLLNQILSEMRNRSRDTPAPK